MLQMEVDIQVDILVRLVYAMYRINAHVCVCPCVNHTHRMSGV